MRSMCFAIIMGLRRRRFPQLDARQEIERRGIRASMPMFMAVFGQGIGEKKLSTTCDTKKNAYKELWIADRKPYR